MSEPRVLKHYEILSRLGEGGMGVVYRARDTRLGRTVALKVLPAELSRDREREQRFEREARMVSSLSHPGIATLYDFDHDGDTSFLTMEYVDGPTLRALLKGGPLPVDELLECGAQIAEAMAAAHAHGIVHRDLKPENIMRSGSGHYKVLDFGVARQDRVPSGADPSFTHRPTEAWATRAGTLLGTVAYMSPEQTLGQDTDARADIFSFGSLLYELATGKPAFTGVNEIAVAQAISFAEPAPVTGLRPDAPPALSAVIRRCLAKKPADRYPDAGEVAQDLRALGQDSRSGARPGGSILKALEPARRRRRRHLAMIAATAALILAVALFLPGLLGPGSDRGDGAIRTDGAARPAPPMPPPGAGAAAVTGVRRLIVAFFDNNSGDPDADWLSRGLPDMLTTDLSGWSGIDVIAPQRLHDLMAMAGHDPEQTMDRSTAAELARWAGAGTVITGSVFKADDEYRIDAQAYDTGTGTVVAAKQVTGTALFDMVGELADGLRQGLAVDATGRPARDGVLMATTRSPEAYQAFIAGQALYDRLDYDAAADRFRQALAVDPGFARARIRLAMSLVNSGRDDEGYRLIEEVAAASADMPEDARLTAQALDACFNAQDLDRCQAGFAELAGVTPRDGEVYVWWARALDESGKPLQAAGKLRAALEHDPANLPALLGMADHLARLGARDSAVTLLEAARARHPGAASRLDALAERYVAAVPAPPPGPAVAD